MRVLYVCTELFPLLKTGGLGDVSAALPPALRDAGCDVRVLLPGFPAIEQGVGPSPVRRPAALPVPAEWGPRLGGSALRMPPRLVQAGLPGGVPAYVLDAPSLFMREGNPYLDLQGDNAVRFALLGWAASCLGHGLDPDWRPDVIHCHDWHTGLAPVYLRQMAMPGPPPAATVFTIHNLAYQGTFPGSSFRLLGLPENLFGMHGLEFFGQVSFLKAGIRSADRVTTVSPTYAREIMLPAQGCGLDGLLRERGPHVSGILNGVDYEVWSPASDPALPRPYDADHPQGKAAAKAALQQAMGLAPQPHALLFGVVTRLTEQKGLHLVDAVVDAIVAMGAQLMVLGMGDPPLEEAFLRAARRHPGRVCTHIGYDESLAHLVMGACDAILVPSRFEPCGLTQLYGLRYGALPVAHRVGGLADTIVDATPDAVEAGLATGFLFDDFSAQGLLSAVRRACEMHAVPRAWRQLQRQAMQQRFDWHESAARYVALYRSIQPLPESPPT